MRFRTGSVSDQKAALKTIVGLIAKGSIDPRVRSVAVRLIEDVPDRDDTAEVEAIFKAVKEGDSRVPALKNGIGYVADPKVADYYHGAGVILELAAKGVRKFDCDDHAILVASLLSSLGFTVGARAYGRAGSPTFEHVYCVVSIPKRGPWPKTYYGHGVDTTVKDSHVGWEPKRGKILTYWLE